MNSSHQGTLGKRSSVPSESQSERYYNTTLATSQKQKRVRRTSSEHAGRDSVSDKLQAVCCVDTLVLSVRTKV